MLKTGKRINSRRVFSDEFKRKLVSDYESGVMSVPQMERHYGISNRSIYKWIYKFSTYNEKNIRIVEMKDSQTHRVNELEEKVKELERAVGQKQIKIDYLEKMIDLAKETYSIDIKKNSNTSPSGGFNPISKR
ncbi:transposase [Algoriphagus ratkowskyi]|uniref:Transposase n=3 Tax=Algoriphagus ratkowskyi TaxID=57028 RepID=A0A2W7QRY3_9BACT|nr:transposase [Algoriphagus ratkowskyi]PZX48800.1 transposase [Algoriphagus ratkowskyi]TXD75268.1 transposase [Algoriphagus ratkowskyi]